jgi:hypothetical protein
MANVEETKLVQIGTSLGIRLKKEALWHLGVSEKDDPIVLSMDENNTITLRKLQPGEVISTESEVEDESL